MSDEVQYFEHRDDAIADRIVDALKDGASGTDISDQFDVDGIADEILDEGYPRGDGIWLFWQRPEIDAAAFWEIVAKHEVEQ